MGNLLDKTIFNQTSIPLLSRVSDLAALRQKLIASNIANVNTPGYTKKQINFEGELKKAIGKPKIEAAVTNERHIPLNQGRNAPPKIESIGTSENSTGLNSVDVETEMSDLAQNQLVFDFGADMLARQFKGLKAAIRGKA